GEPRLLTDHPVGVSGGVEFAPDSGRIAYLARVPEEGRYGTAEGVGPEAEPPRHIRQFTYRIDGVGFYADRPQHVFVLELPAPPDPIDQPPGTAARAEALAADDDAGPAGADESGAGAEAEDAPAGGKEALAAGARKELDVAPVQVTSGTGEHREAVWAAGGSQL